MTSPTATSLSPFADLLPGKHLVFDNQSVADTYRLRRCIHRPQRESLAPFFKPEKPWEGNRVTPLHVEHDAKRARWRLWYFAFDPQADAERKALGVSTHGNVGAPQPFYCCYAESEDGLQWERPALGIYPHAAGDNNICFKGVSGAVSGTILHRPEAPAHQRYLMTNCDWLTEAVGGIFIAQSADGIHWEYTTEKPLVFGESDTWNSLAYNAERGVYMLYMRAWHSAAEGWISEWVGGAGAKPPHKNVRRRVAYSESADLKTWTEPQVILTPDELDTNDFYGLQVFRYEDMYLGQLWIHDDDERETIHTELIWSRDGIRWQRHPQRPVFIAPGEAGQSDGYMMVPSQQPVLVNGELWHYHSGCDGPHDTGGRYTSYRGRLRLDGFCSLQADRRLGALITRPFVLQSDSISINAATHGGEIRAELVEPYLLAEEGDPHGRAIEGFAAADFDDFRGDSSHHRLSWRGSSNLSTLRGKRVMLKISLYHAELYSFTL